MFSRNFLIGALIFLLIAGCISENRFDSSSKDLLITSVPWSIPGSSDDVFVATYAPVVHDDVSVKRTVVASAVRTTSFDSYRQLSDLDVITISSHYTSFIRSIDSQIAACDNSLGLVVNCIDSRTCAELCSKNSRTCKELYDADKESLGNQIFAYVLTKRDLESARDTFKTLLPTLRSLDDREREDLNRLFGQTVNDVVALQASPVYTYSPLALCANPEYDLSSLVLVRDLVGQTSTETAYKYDVFLQVDRDSSSLSQKDIELKESFVENEMKSFNSFQKTVLQSDGGKDTISFEPIKEKEAILHYSFVSSRPPQELFSEFNSPAVLIRTLDFSFLDPFFSVVKLFFSLTGNLFLSLALGLGIITVILLVAYNFVQIIFYTAFSGSLSKSALTHSFRKAFGRPRVHWKTDAAVAVVLIVGGFALAVMSASPLSKFPELSELVSLILYADPLALIGSVGIFFGIVLAYLALENRIKITYLESLYGHELKADRDVIVAQVAELKSRYSELKELIEKQTRENFDVGEEHDVLATISIQRIDELSKSSDASAKKVIDDSLLRVDSAVRSLLEKRKTADENWVRWGDLVAKQLSENDQVYASSLIPVPKSLRSWALSRYVKEHPHDALSFEGDLIRKKATTLDHQVSTLFDDGLLSGLVILKSDKVIFSRLAGGASATLVNVLSVRLVLYLRSLLRQIRQTSYSSFASVGESTVLAIIKQDAIESILLIPKDKFKDALDEAKQLLKKINV